MQLLYCIHVCLIVQPQIVIWTERKQLLGMQTLRKNIFKKKNQREWQTRDPTFVIDNSNTEINIKIKVIQKETDLLRAPRDITYLKQKKSSMKDKCNKQMT